MTLWGSLFIKLFIAFWLVTVVTLGSWQLASTYFESQPPSPESSDLDSPGPPNRFILRTIYNLENLNSDALAGELAKVQNKYDIQIYLLDRVDKDLLGRQVPRKVAEIAGELRSVRRNFFLRTSKGRLAAHQIYRQDLGALTAVFVFPLHQKFILNALTGSLWLRIGLAVLISGIICYILSRLMTSRLKDLQSASRRLANGELETRLAVRDEGGDETDELARDFNSMAKQLQERIGAQKRLLGDVSHELRSPLARMHIALALVQEKPADAAKYMRRIENEAHRLEELISQLLASQAQSFVLDTAIDLVPLLERLCADANFEAQGAGKAFIFNTEVKVATINSCGDLLHKSFENILRNALHHTAENSKVTVSLLATESAYEIRVEDEGPGVPENDLDKIFGEFYRVDTARTRESGGHGLGLAIARRAVLQHGGEVTAQNTGSGLRITIRLPLPELQTKTD
jgi:two-component system sensor histidine kinase CpxA